ncbi:MAG: hypothetical protein MZW92_53525 [Comamonadaceae bacterium]|nr:hypothetical protein [Comamonadaceae bacterium]
MRRARAPCRPGGAPRRTRPSGIASRRCRARRAVPRRPRAAPRDGDAGWPLFRVGHGRYAEFADAPHDRHAQRARASAATSAALRPGDLLYFRQDGAGGSRSPDGLSSARRGFEAGRARLGRLSHGPGPADGPGEVRKARARRPGAAPRAAVAPLSSQPGVHRRLSTGLAMIRRPLRAALLAVLLVAAAARCGHHDPPATRAAAGIHPRGAASVFTTSEQPVVLT